MSRAPDCSAPTETQLLGQAVEAARMFGVVLERSNTGMALNPKGQPVRFGTPGDPDLRGTLPSGRAVHVELKRPGFDPAKLRGAKLEHFRRQLGRMTELNGRGAAAWWASDVADVVRGLEILRDYPHATIEFDPDMHNHFHYRD